MRQCARGHAIRATIDLLDDKNDTPWINAYWRLIRSTASLRNDRYFFVLNRRYEEASSSTASHRAEADLWSAHSQLGINLMRLGGKRKLAKN